MDSLNDPIWLSHVRKSLGGDLSEVLLDALGEEPSVSIRLNPLKKAEVDFGCMVEPVKWSPDGLILSERPCFTLDPLFHAGAYYVQDSSSMYVGHVFRALAGDFWRGGSSLRVLDLCAAPGGKTTDLAASLRAMVGDKFILVSNEVIKKRAVTLCDNVALWGDPNIVVTSADPAAFAAFSGFFDVILTDVPCSGEGMFRKDSGAVRDWSEGLVDLCSSRQRRILGDVWPALREGGLLIYSTCTFEEAENDSNVEWVCDSLGADGLLKGCETDFEEVVPTRMGRILIPGRVCGEGQYVSALKKTSGTPSGLQGGAMLFDRMRVRSHEAEPMVHTRVELNRGEALRYLHGDSFRLSGDAPQGMVTITYKGLPLGNAKNLGTRINNLYPKSRRIIMDINNRI